MPDGPPGDGEHVSQEHHRRRSSRARSLTDLVRLRAPSEPSGRGFSPFAHARSAPANRTAPTAPARPEARDAEDTMTELLTGAQSPSARWSTPGSTSFGIPAGDPARVRPAHGLRAGTPHPGPPRAGLAPPRRRGLRPGDRPRRRLHGDVGPGRHQPGHRDRRRLPTWTRCRSSPSRPGAERQHRHRRLPGGRHPRHHDDADHQHNYLVTDPAEIPRAVAEAFHIAGTGRPGPVLVDIAKDALQASTTSARPDQIDLPRLPPRDAPARRAGARGRAMIVEAKRPVLYVGGGVIKAHASEELRRLADPHRHPGHDHAFMARRVPDSHPPAPRHARVCTAGGQRRAAEERPASSPSAPASTTASPVARLVRTRRAS